MKKAQQASFPEFEAEILAKWQEEGAFERSLELREKGPRFRFYDGPPFTSGPPHYGHLEQSTLKDAIARYKTMRGYYVPRRTGADTHGLPIENLVEKEHGFRTKQDIVEFGIDKFNAACRSVVFRHRGDFDEMYRRLGRWDDSTKSYATLQDDYIESVWNVFSRLYEKDLVYKGFKSMPYCPRCATPLSNFEVNDGYQDDVPDPSVYVKFRLAGEAGGSDAAPVSLLAWTTTPWTLPANAALAVDAGAKYVTVELKADGDGWKKGERLILAKSRLEVLELREAEYEIVAEMRGAELAGKKYRPLYSVTMEMIDAEREAVHTVYTDESVSLEDGTGVLHVAPRYGETDLAMGQRVGLPLLESVDGTGKIVESLASVDGLEGVVNMFFKDADPHIIADLTKKGRIFAAETFTHTYPFCWRCETPLLYFATPSWFVAVSRIREELVRAGQEIKWVPEHVGTGRFIKWLENARDWAISRTRFWGAPLPVWENMDDPADRIVVGSLAELRELAGLTGDAAVDMHRPGIDELVIERDGKKYRRVEEVFDCWFESGSMPYAQEHYPFENKKEFEESFPAEFVCEAIEQVHLWFYTLHVLSVALTGGPAYRNVIATGLILGADGRKLSKRLRNYPPIEEVFAEHGADVLRFFILESPLMSGGDTRFSNDALRDVTRNVFMTLWNSYSFMSMYAEIDGWQPAERLAVPASENVLDKWLVARLNQTVAEVTRQADAYQVAKAVRPLRELIDDMSNWYVRRSRRRFWKSEDDGDKAAAYATLHYVLCRIAQLMAPWSPFAADKMWRELTAGMAEAESVHLSDWPEVVEADEAVLEGMAMAREAVTLGLASRAAAGVKVRQPLALLEVRVPVGLSDDLVAIIREEVNVKEVRQTVDAEAREVVASVDAKITPELKREGIMRDVIRHAQQARKNAGLAVDDRIVLTLIVPAADDEAAGEVSVAIDEYAELIMVETLAVELRRDGEDGGDGGVVPVKVNGAELFVQVAKA